MIENSDGVVEGQVSLLEVDTENVKPTSYDKPKSTMATIVLPRGFVLNRGGSKTVLNHAVLRELRGREEDYIADESTLFTRRMVMVVQGCMVELSDGGDVKMTMRKDFEKAIGKLPIGDLTACLFGIRAATLGTEIKQKITCPNEKCDSGGGQPCTWIGKFDILRDFPVKPCKGEPSHDVRTYVTTLGNKVTWQFMTADARIKYESNMTQNKSRKSTAALMMRVLTVNDQPATMEILQDMGSTERSELREYMTDQEGGIDTSIGSKCLNCGHEFNVELAVNGFSFFFHSGTSED